MKNSTETFKIKSTVRSGNRTVQKSGLRSKWFRFIAPSVVLIIWMIAIKYSLESGGPFLKELSLSGFIVALLLLFANLDKGEKRNHQKNPH